MSTVLTKKETSHKLPAIYDPMSVEAPHSPGDVFYYADGAVPFLRLRVSATSRTWVFDKNWNGRHIKRAIGEAVILGIHEARHRACELAREIEFQGEPPFEMKVLQPRGKKSLTYRECFEAYLSGHLEQHAAKTTIFDAESGFRRFFERFHNVPVKQISRHDVQMWFQWMGTDIGKATANKQLQVFNACLNWCDNQELIDLMRLPTKGLKKFKEEARSRYLRQPEVERLMNVLQTVSSEIADPILLMLLTAARKNDVFEMHWDDVDIEAGIWRIPKTKNGKSHVAPLTEAALKILRRRRETNFNSEWVFPSVGKTGHLRDINRGWHFVRIKAGLEDVHLHDLRHSAASWLALSGANAMTIQRVLGHSSIKMSERYTHLDTNFVRDAMTKSHGVLLGEDVVKEPEPAQSQKNGAVNIPKLGRLLKWGNPIAPNPKKDMACLKNRVPRRIEDAVVKFASEQPMLGKKRAALELRKRGIKISPNGVGLIWLRNDLENSHKRLRAADRTRDSQLAVEKHNEITTQERGKIERICTEGELQSIEF